MKIRGAIAVISLCWLGLTASVWAEEPLTGDALCVSCHDADDLPDMGTSPHGPTLARKLPPMTEAAQALRSRPMGDAANPAAPACVSCHGPSVAHMNKPAGASKLPPPDVSFNGKAMSPAHERSEACVTCHNKEIKHTLWTGSQHQAADVACNACHKVHVKRDKVLSRATQAEVCITCHKEQRTQLNKPSHHPVFEGKMTCSDCHNSHGSAGPKLVKRDSINATCYTCHAEKRGPFVRQHDPVAEDCSTCHNSHGSNVAGMLKVRAPMLCQQCHSTAHSGSTVGSAPGGLVSLNATGMWQGRSCTNCHTQIHGSNNPSSNFPRPSGFSPNALMR